MLTLFLVLLINEWRKKLCNKDNLLTETLRKKFLFENNLPEETPWSQIHQIMLNEYRKQRNIFEKFGVPMGRMPIKTNIQPSAIF